MGLGEPLMNPHFFELLDIAQSKNIKASLITNGTLLQENNIKKLNNNLVKIYISIDGASRKNFEEIRKGANFSNLIENIQKIRKLKPEIELCILTILMKETLKDLPELVKLSKKINVKYIGLNHILSLNQENDKRFVSSDTSEAKYYLQKAGDLAEKYKIKIISRPLHPTMRRCWQPWLAPLIMLNGDLYPCCFMDRSSKSIDTEWYSGVPIEVPFHQYKMGNIFTDSFGKIWNNEDFKLLRKKIRKFEKGSKVLSEKELNLKRQRANLKEKFSYCEICLWRWSVAC
jgi:MoaA/NifB/PqqE/SkfB family radical SAM enzyme